MLTASPLKQGMTVREPDKIELEGFQIHDTSNAKKIQVKCEGLPHAQEEGGNPPAERKKGRVGD